MSIFLSKEELKKLLDLTHEAETTPVIALSLEDGLRGKDWSAQAWDRVRDNWKELGKKYGFEPSQVKGIDSSTREVLT